MTEPKTLLEAVRTYSDLDTCHAYMLRLKWPDGKITCPACGSENVGQIASRRMLQCRDGKCRKQFSAKVGTIFEDSPLPLSSWFVAVWSIANCKNGISSLELSRALGVTQKTAWFMLHRIRLAMRTETFRKPGGVIESDETYIGGKAENMHARKRQRRILGRGSVGKAIVHGLLERQGEVRASVIPNTEQETLAHQIIRNLDPTAVICTDASQSYAGLVRQFIHHAIDHTVGYVRGKVHVNGIENFWSLLKRMLRGTYVAVAPFHLFRYLDEETWRFNQRHGDDGDRFRAVMQTVLGRRITYRNLCAIDDAGFMGLT